MSTHIEANVLPIEVSWSWVSTTQGVVNWKFKNPNSVPLNFVLVRGVSTANSTTYPQNIYLFGDAFYPLYYYDFGTQFQSGQPTPLKSSIVQPPLAVFQAPNGNLQAGFIFTLGANGSWNMNEGGFVGIEPAGISTVIVSYSQTTKFSINYNKQISCQQYNSQAGTNYPCPPDPFVVESAMFLLPTNIPSEVPNDIITEVGSSSGGGSSGNIDSCITGLIDAILGGNIKQVVENLTCIFGGIDTSTQVELRGRLEELRSKL